MNLKNHNNDYARALLERGENDLFTDCPKAVCAAIAVSALTCGGEYLEKARSRFALEWKRLHDAGIVPQKPPAYALKLAATAKTEEDA